MVGYFTIRILLRRDAKNDIAVQAYFCDSLHEIISKQMIPFLSGMVEDTNKEGKLNGELNTNEEAQVCARRRSIASVSILQNPGIAGGVNIYDPVINRLTGR